MQRCGLEQVKQTRKCIVRNNFWQERTENVPLEMQFGGVWSHLGTTMSLVWVPATWMNSQLDFWVRNVTNGHMDYIYMDHIYIYIYMDIWTAHQRLFSLSETWRKNATNSQNNSTPLVTKKFVNFLNCYKLKTMKAYWYSKLIFWIPVGAQCK